MLRRSCQVAYTSTTVTWSVDPILELAVGRLPERDADLCSRPPSAGFLWFGVMPWYGSRTCSRSSRGTETTRAAGAAWRRHRIVGPMEPEGVPRSGATCYRYAGHRSLYGT